MKIKNIVVKIIAAIEVLLIFIIFVLFYLNTKVYTSEVIFVPKGSINYTINFLQKDNPFNFIDTLVLRTLGMPQQGWIDIKSNNLSRWEFLYRLTTSKAHLVKVTIIPGESTYFVYKNIEKIFGFEVDCSLKEGILKPDTYYLPKSITNKNLCSYLRNVSFNYHKKFYKNMSWKDYYNYLIIASIIQKEAANKDEMRLISSVIYNRLKKGMKLQMDGTLNYGKYSHTKVTPLRIRKDNTSFNTYKFYGLPKEAIAIPSEDAIKAAFYPIKSNYLYFVKCGKTHKFAKSYKEHLRNIRQCK